MSLLKAGIGILMILELFMFLMVFADQTAASMFLVASFDPLFTVLILLLLFLLLRKIEKLEKKAKDVPIPNF